MRSLKFRAWDCVESKFLDPKQFHINGNGKIMCSREIIVIQQFTGLHDKNGEEIYEGDILSQKYRNKIRVILVRELSAYGVIFNCPHFNFYRDIVNKESLEVIGNIYENPELIEGKSIV